MKKCLQLLLMCVLYAGYTKAQNKSWTYNFGTSTTVQNLSTTHASGVLSAIDGTLEHKDDILPAPENGQIARIWTGNRVNNTNINSFLGGFSLTTAGTIGSGAKLLFKAAATSSTHKFSILNIAGTSVMSIGFKLKFDSGTKGDYRFSIGRDVSAMNWTSKSGGTGATPYSSTTNFNDANISGLPSMLLMHWNIDNGVYKLSIREKRSTVSANLDGFKAIGNLNPSINFVNGGEYDIQVYANNSSDNASYTKNNTLYTVTARSSHVWVNNTILLYEAGNPNFIDQDSNLSPDAVLNAFIFLGYNNDQNGNDAQAYLDNFVYANYLENINVLPVVLDRFSATKQSNSVQLNWKTLSEKDNARFEILRSGDKDQNQKLIKTVAGKGNTAIGSTYSATDNSPFTGNNYYKLVQVDVNGKTDTLATALAKVGFSKNDFTVYAKGMSVKLSINASNNENATVEVYNLAGQSLATEKLKLTSGANQLTVPVNLVKGVYVAVLTIKDEQYKTKFVIN